MKQHIGNTAVVMSRPVWRFALLATIFAAVLRPAPARADVITEWNAKADEIAVAKKVPAPVQGRGQAILHVAMVEAVTYRGPAATRIEVALAHESLALLWAQVTVKTTCRVGTGMSALDERHAACAKPPYRFPACRRLQDDQMLWL
jgi:hypothetical protein